MLNKILFFCIGARLLLAYLAYKFPYKEFAYLTFLIAVVWLTLWTFSLRTQGIEVLDGSHKIWWNNLRPLHAAIYLLFSYSIYHSNSSAYQYLLLDAGIGATVFSLKYMF